MRRRTPPLLFAAALLTALSPGVRAQAPPSAAPAAPASTAAEAQAPLFAVEIRTGPSWDAAKRPQDQAFFREHSAHLKRLRDEGRLLVGARYAEKGLLVLRAASEDEAHALVKADPSMQAGTFAYSLAEFRVFYGGSLQPPARRP
jgi:uncharacterized protein YciI